MATTEDRWHSQNPQRDDVEICSEHSSKRAQLYPSSVHGTGKRWAVRWRDESRKERRKSFTLKGDADKFAAKVTHELEVGQHIDPKARRTLLWDVCEEWLQASEHRPTTAEDARRQLALHVRPNLGGKPVGSIKRGDIQLWLKDRQKTLAGSTTAIVYGRLKAVLTFAVHNDLIVKNPCAGVSAPKVTRKEVTPLPTDVVAALVAAAPPRYRAMLLLAAGSGLRYGELVGLEIAALDLDAGEVHVRQQAVKLNDGAPYIGPPKTDHSYRTVPLAKGVVEALSEHVRRFPPVAVELADRTDPRKPHSRTAHLVFGNSHARPINGGGWSRVWSNTVKRANASLAASGGEVPAGASMHDLRHTYASLLIAHRESVKVVQKRLGHAKASVTLDVYVHLFDDVEDTTRDAVQNVLGGIAVTY